MRLTKSQPCPIHNGSKVCCGRSPKQQMPRRATFNRGLKRIPDDTVERGYREIRSKSEMRRLLLVKVREQNGICALCKKPIEDMRDAVLDHIEPRGMGAARRNDAPDAVQASHNLCNLEKGSRRDYAPS